MIIFDACENHKSLRSIINSKIKDLSSHINIMVYLLTFIRTK